LPNIHPPKFSKWFKAPRFEPRHAEMFFSALESEFLLHQVNSNLLKIIIMQAFY